MFLIGFITVRRLLFIRITEKGMKFPEQITAGFKNAFLEENTSVKTIEISSNEILLFIQKLLAGYVIEKYAGFKLWKILQRKQMAI